jgi:hypothetical protein
MESALKLRPSLVRVHTEGSADLLPGDTARARGGLAEQMVSQVARRVQESLRDGRGCQVITEPPSHQAVTGLVAPARRASPRPDALVIVHRSR